MTRQHLSRTILILTALAIASTRPTMSQAQSPKGSTFDLTMPPGANFDKAEFRLWYPSDVGTIRSIVVIVPGSNGDWRTMVDDTVWQNFAVRHHAALLGLRLTDLPHDQSFIEDYCNVSKGSGQLLLDAVNRLASTSKHAELATAPFLMWGMSAGGQFNYEFTAWKPERVAAFVVNKGGIYYTALTSQTSRNVPGILFTGGKDLESRISTIDGLFAVNRRSGALWAIAQEPSAAHIVGRSRDLTLIFFDEVLALRLGAPSASSTGPVAMKTLTEQTGFLGDPKTKTFHAFGVGSAPNYPTAWLPSERVAKAWQALVSEQPFPP